MKIKIVLPIVFFLLSTLSSLAQNFPFPQDSASWTYIGFPWDAGIQYFPNTIHYDLFGDTLINGEHYSFISHYIHDCEGSGNYDYDFLRSEGDKVYFLKRNSLNEVLLYDFNLEAGDFFPVAGLCGYQDTDSIEVKYTDSLLIGESYRKIWALGNQEIAYWIEGIGQDNGFGTMIGPYYAEYPLDGIQYNILCYKEHGEELISRTASYTNWSGVEFTFSCNGIIQATEDLSKQNLVKVFPNPFTAILNVQYENFRDIESIELYDVSGRLVETLPLSESFDLSFLKPTLYLLKVRANGNFYYQRIIKTE
ncbi:MAG: T9SS C-terminal target domain-containing protein [Bacteroidetes bacterium]|nr:MAG: T9SS C-terminal target domain-containing protein [Bacteroidota bacterium]